MIKVVVKKELEGEENSGKFVLVYIIIKLHSGYMTYTFRYVIKSSFKPENFVKNGQTADL